MKRVLLVAILLFLVIAGVLLGHRRKTGTTHSVTLTWQAPASAQSSAPLRYNVYRSDDAGRSYPCIARRATETSYVDASVESGKSYRYAVTAIDVRGLESARSDEVTVSVP